MSRVFATVWRRAAGAAIIATAFSPAPAAAQVSVLGGTVVEHAAGRGERHDGVIVVSNDTDEEQNVRIYQTDYLFFADGRSPFDAPGSHARSNAAWIQPAVRTMRLPPRGQVTLGYEIRVPDDSSLAGTYWSTIMVEPISSLQQRQTRRGGVSVNTVMRYAVQIATHIGVTGSRSVRFLRTALEANGSAAQIATDVENAGSLAFRPLIWIEIFDTEGELVFSAREQRGLLYPGTSLRQKFALGQLPAGEYRAVLYVDSGEESVFAAQLRLQF